MQAQAAALQPARRAAGPRWLASLGRWLGRGLPRWLGWIYVALALSLALTIGVPALAPALEAGIAGGAGIEVAAPFAAAAQLGVPGWTAAALWAYVGALLASANPRGLWVCLACTPAMALATALWGWDAAAQGWPLAALTPPQVALQWLEHRSLRVAMPLSPASWLAYLAQWVLLFPALRATVRAWRAARERALRESTFVLPAAIADLYARHPLRVLGLSVGEARTRAIMRRRDELLTLAAAGLPVHSELPGFVAVALAAPAAATAAKPRGSPAGAPPATPEEAPDEAQIKRAVARLQHEPERCEEALLWFQLDGEPDAVRAALARGEFDAADATWRARCTPGGVGRGAALYNRAVLAHLRVIAAEQHSSPPHAVRNEQPWQDSHRLWAQVLASPEAWSCVEGFVSMCSDPRIGPDHAAQLRTTLALRVLRVHADLARAAMSGGFTAYAKVHLERIGRSELPAPAKARVLDEFFQPQVEAVQEILHPFQDAARPLTDGIDYAALRSAYERARAPLVAFGATSRLEPLARAALAEACDRLPRETYGPWRQFNDDDLACFRGTAALIDRWNQQSGSGGSGVDVTVLRQVLAVMKGHRQMVQRLDDRMRTYDDCARRALEAGRCLQAVAQDAAEAEREQLAKVLKDEEAALTRSRDELRKTKEHYERNLQGMGQALGV